MTLDFDDINDEWVGYRVGRSGLDQPFRLETVTFGEFILPYSHGAQYYLEVYSKLQAELKRNRKSQDSVTYRKRSCMIDVLAYATLEREAIMNSMNLINKKFRPGMSVDRL